MVTLLLAAATLTGFASLSASASEHYGTRRATYSGGGITLDSYLRTYTDTSYSPARVVKAYAYSSYNGDTSKPLTTQPVYMVNEVAATGTTPTSHKVPSGNFNMSQTNHVDEYQMQNNMWVPASPQNVRTLKSSCTLASFDVNKPHTATYYYQLPYSSEVQYAKVSAFR